MTPTEKSQLQKVVVDSLPPAPHGRLLLAPRIGKTKIIIDLIKRDKPDSILWVTPSRELADNVIPVEFARWGAKRYLKKLTTITWSSLHKVEGHYDLVVFDEEQFITPANIARIFDLSYNNIISMTGTKTGHKDKLELYKELKLPVLYDIDINKAVDIGLLSNYQITVVNIKEDLNKMKDYKRIQSAINRCHIGQVEFKNSTLHLSGGFTGSIAMQEKPSPYGGVMFTGSVPGSHGYVVVTPEGLRGKLTVNGAPYQIRNTMLHKPYHPSLLIGRVRAIGESPLKTEVTKALLNKLNGRKLVFCSTIAQAEEVSPVRYHSKTTNKDLMRFQNREVDTIAMVNTGGIGFTYTEIDHLFVVQCDSNKNGLISQKICRTLLSQGNYKAHIILLCVKETQDEVWVEKVLSDFDQTKVKYINYETEILPKNPRDA